jgi:hypothetical protein
VKNYFSKITIPIVKAPQLNLSEEGNVQALLLKAKQQIKQNNTDQSLLFLSSAMKRWKNVQSIILILFISL